MTLHRTSVLLLDREHMRRPGIAVLMWDGVINHPCTASKPETDPDKATLVRQRLR
jgi:hypothetical protein